MKKVIKSIFGLLFLVFMTIGTAYSQANPSGINRTYGIRFYPVGNNIYHAGICGIGVTDVNGSGVKGCLTSMHHLGFDFLDTSVCSPVKQGGGTQPAFGQVYLDHPVLNDPRYNSDGCLSRTQDQYNYDPCIEGQSYAMTYEITNGDGCYSGGTNIDAGIVQAAKPNVPNVPILNNDSDWAVWGLAPAGVPAGKMGGKWSYGQGNGGLLTYNSAYYGQQLTLVENNGGPTLIYAGPALLAVGPNYCVFEPPTPWTANFATWGWTGGPNWTLPGTISDPSSPCGSMIYANELSATLIQVTYPSGVTAPYQDEDIQVFFNTSTANCWEPVGMLDAISGNNPNVAYMEDDNTMINALNNFAWSPLGQPAKYGTYNWKIMGNSGCDGTNPRTMAVNASVEGTADTLDQPEMPIDMQISQRELAAAPDFKTITKLISKNTNGNVVRINAAHVNVDKNGNPTFVYSAIGKCGGEMPPTDLQDKIRAMHSGSTPVTFEAGNYASYRPMNFKGCK